MWTILSYSYSFPFFRFFLDCTKVVKLCDPSANVHEIQVGVSSIFPNEWKYKFNCTNCCLQEKITLYEKTWEEIIELVLIYLMKKTSGTCSFSLEQILEVIGSCSQSLLSFEQANSNIKKFCIAALKKEISLFSSQDNVNWTLVSLDNSINRHNQFGKRKISRLELGIENYKKNTRELFNNAVSQVWNANIGHKILLYDSPTNYSNNKKVRTDDYNYEV